jgi:hypothetical protein
VIARPYRAQLPGGNIGPYVVLQGDVPTMQSMFTVSPSRTTIS